MWWMWLSTTGSYVRLEQPVTHEGRVEKRLLAKPCALPNSFSRLQERSYVQNSEHITLKLLCCTHIYVPTLHLRTQNRASPHRHRSKSHPHPPAKITIDWKIQHAFCTCNMASEGILMQPGIFERNDAFVANAWFSFFSYSNSTTLGMPQWEGEKRSSGCNHQSYHKQWSCQSGGDPHAECCREIFRGVSCFLQLFWIVSELFHFMLKQATLNTLLLFIVSSVDGFALPPGHTHDSLGLPIDK